MNADLRKIVVTGASGNLGTALLRRLATDLPDVEVVGLCRRPPGDVAPYDRARWHPVDLASRTAPTRLRHAFRGADAVVHLAWALQPVRDEDAMYRVNIGGSHAVLRAATAAGVPHLVHASSLAVYAPGEGPVDERWPDSGQRESAYSRQKVTVERLLDHFERDHPDVTVARIRPTLVVQRAAAGALKALFLGPLVSRPALEVLRRGLLPVVALPSGIAVQVVHADDVASATVRILQRRCGGAYNLAADPLDARRLAAAVGSEPLELPGDTLRAAVSALFELRLVPVSPGWFDVAVRSPLMDTARARADLDWRPRHSSVESVRELLDGLADGASGPSPALGG